MKILIDARLYGLENAGLGRYSLNLVRELAKIDRKNSYFILLKEKYFKEVSLPGSWQKILADFGHYSLAEQVKIPKIVKSVKPDISHFLHFNVPTTLGTRFIVTIHDMLMHKQRGLSATTLSWPAYFLKRIGYKLVFKKAILGSIKIIVPSQFVKNEIVNYYKVKEDKVAVTYEGSDESLISKPGKRGVLKKYDIDAPYFIYAGNAYPHKNLARAIEAVVDLNKNSQEKVLFVIASARSVFGQRLEKLVSRLGAYGQVKLLGFVPDDELGGLYQGAVGYLFPSLSEGFGLTGLEAMAAGTIVLVSDIPVFREVYKGNAIYFNPYDFSSIEKAMRDVISMDVSRRKEIIKNGQKFASRYSWDKMAKQTLKVYEDCAGL